MGLSKAHWFQLTQFYAHGPWRQGVIFHGNLRSSTWSVPTTIQITNNLEFAHTNWPLTISEFLVMHKIADERRASPTFLVASVVSRTASLAYSFAASPAVAGFFSWDHSASEVAGDNSSTRNVNPKSPDIFLIFASYWAPTVICWSEDLATSVFHRSKV